MFCFGVCFLRGKEGGGLWEWEERGSDILFSFFVVWRKRVHLENEVEVRVRLTDAIFFGLACPFHPVPCHYVSKCYSIVHV